MPILGGFVMTIDESMKWASRVAKKPITAQGVGFGVLLRYMMKRGFDVSIVCHPAGISKFMVVTQYGPTIERWKASDDPTKLPQFEEGSIEEYTRKALDKSGVANYEFVTAHGRL